MDSLEQRRHSTNGDSVGARQYRLARWAFGLAVAGLLLWLAADVILLLFAAVLAAVFLRGLARLLSSHTALSEGWSLLVVILCLTAIGIGSVWAGAPRIAEQLDQLSEDLPRSLDRLTAAIQQYEWGRWLLRQAASIESMERGGGGETLKEVGRQLSSRLASALGGVVSTSFGAVINIALILAIGTYLAAGFEKYQRGLLRLFPRHQRERAAEVTDTSIHVLEGWLLGIAISMTILGVLSFIGLSLLGVPLALTFALLTAFLMFIPNIGPFVSVIPPALLALTVNPMTSLYVMMFYLVLQNTEGFFITPMVQQRTARMPPPLLLATQVVMAVLLGPFGLLLAAPLCALGLVLVQLLYIEDHLGEQVDIPGYVRRPRVEQADVKDQPGSTRSVWQT